MTHVFRVGVSKKTRPLNKFKPETQKQNKKWEVRYI